jgi:hypothetical protein
MTRLFDSGSARKEKEDKKRSREEVRERAEAADAAIAAELDLEKESNDLGAKLAQAQTITAIRYLSYRQPGSKWRIEHAVEGTDYIYQLFPLKPQKAEWQDTLTLMISVMDAIFPRTMEIIYSPPRPDYEIQFYTIRVKGPVGTPGWEKACKERTLRSLCELPT